MGVASTAPGRARGATQATPTKPLNGYNNNYYTRVLGHRRESGASEGNVTVFSRLSIFRRSRPRARLIGFGAGTRKNVIRAPTRGRIPVEAIPGMGTVAINWPNSLCAAES